MNHIYYSHKRTNSRTMEISPSMVQENREYDKKKEDTSFIYCRDIFQRCHPEDWCCRKHHITYLEWVVSDVCIHFSESIAYTHLRTFTSFRSRSQQKSNLDIIVKVKADDICIGQAELDLDELIDKNETGSSIIRLNIKFGSW